MISNESLEEFKQIYLEEFGVQLSNEEALEKALPVLNLVKTLIEPVRNLSIDADKKEMSL